MPTLVKTLISGICLSLLISCDNNSKTHLGFSRLEQIKHEGALHVLTRQDPTTYYEGPDGRTGLEYDLIMLFGRYLGVEVHFIIPNTFEEILYKISHGEADIAAAGLTVTKQRKQIMRFAPPYQTITEQVIYRSGTRRPKRIRDLNRGIIEVVKGTSHEATLKSLQKIHPQLEWNVNSELDSDGLLYLVNQGLIDYTIADSQQAAIVRSFYPKLNVAFDITEPRQLAWALSPSNDDSLYDKVLAFFQQIKQDNTLQALLEKHYGHANNLNYVGNCKFRQHIKKRLPAYRQYFKAAGEKHNIDWRLLAAIGYQESHWKEKATSPTGVQGLMMLTRGTARQLGIKNRTDPRQSINGGARYFKQRLKKIPERIPEPDRTWFALASYNVGFGHLEDARIITQERGGNPDKWMDVKQSLPLLSKKMVQKNQTWLCQRTGTGALC
nr:membrane-bound lytic murein transglycosylase MltF [Methylomarinum sp. Ch1-1]MDP4522929.1 membrane-bound lytic murein transglycosylase MltF [Methylomarinum sp. Ch1-1]